MQVCGLVLFGLGFVLYIDRESQLHGQLLHLLPSSGPLIAIDKIPAVLAGTGTTILLLSFLGCYGACVESVCFLWLVGLLCHSQRPVKEKNGAIHNNTDGYKNNINNNTAKMIIGCFHRMLSHVTALPFITS